jgi:lysophospholipase L1-like esterase
MRWLLRLALLVEFALVLECTCRVDDWIRYRMPLWTPVKAKEDLIVIDAEGEHGRPHAQFQSWALNNVGMRGPDVEIPKPPGVIRIVTAGASETFGLYESAGHSYPRLLEDSLRALVRREACPTDPPPTIEVLNEAIFGMSLPTMAQDLRLRVAQLQPDLVVVYPTPMYYLAAAMPVRARPDSTGAPTRLPPIGVLYPRAIHRMHDALKSITPRWLAAWVRARQDAYDERHLPPNWHFTTIPPDRLAAYESDLRRVVETVRAIGAVPLLVTHANAFMDGSTDDVWMSQWTHQYPRATAATLLAFDSAAGPITIQIARASSVALVDLAAQARRGLFLPDAQSFADYAHFSDIGAARVAGALAPVVATTAHLRSCPRLATRGATAR